MDGRQLANGRIFSEDGYEGYISGRKERNHTTDGRVNPRIYANIGFAFPQLYKIRKDARGNEFIIIKGHRFNA